MTPKVAEDLVATMDSAAVAQQVEVYDFLREQAPDDPRLSPGRLRRMIEEDWTPPPDFIPAAERARRAALATAVAEEQRRRQAAAREEEQRRREAADAEYAALLASLGLHAEDQAQWRVLVESPQRLPTVFCHALFYAPRDMTPPVVILRHRGDRELAMCAGYDKHRAEIEQRLCDRFPQYARTRFTAGSTVFVAYEEALAAFQTLPEEDERAGAVPVAEQPDLASPTPPAAPTGRLGGGR